MCISSLSVILNLYEQSGKTRESVSHDGRSGQRVRYFFIQTGAIEENRFEPVAAEAQEDGIPVVGENIRPQDEDNRAAFAYHEELQICPHQNPGVWREVTSPPLRLP